MQRFLRLALAVSSAIVAMLALPTVGRAQGVTTGGIGGLITDAAGVPLEGAQIRITSPSTGTVRTAVTRANGRYTVSGLETGLWKVSAAAIGFGPKSLSDVRVQLSQIARADFQLERQAVTLAEIVTTAPAIGATFSPTRTGAQTYISDTMVSRLPTLNRQLQDFFRASPQVTLNPGRPGDISAAGQNNRFNAIQVDGTTQNDRFGLGDTGELGGQANGRGISLESVKEYQIVVSPYNVTQGGFTGALINAVTKNGTNKLATTGFFTYRNQDLATNDPVIAQTKFSIKQYGASVGGPLVKDKLHFFLAGELLRSTRPAGGPYIGQTGLTAANAVRVDQATIDAFNSALSAYNITGGSGDAQSNLNPVGSFVGRLDWNITPSSRMVFRQIYNDQKADDFSRSAGTFALTSNRFLRAEKVSSSTLQFFKNFSGGSSNEMQLGYIRQRFARSFDQNTPQITIFNIPSPTVAGQLVTLRAGSDSSSHVNQLDQDFLEFRNDYTFAFGGNPNHSVTIGTRSDMYKVRNAFIQNAFGSWGFASIDSLIAGNANRYSIGTALGDDPVARFKAMNVAFYLQDQWSASRNLTLTIGLRAEAPIFLDKPGVKEDLTTDLGRTTDQVPSNWTFNPRLGFNYDVNGAGRTQIRGGVGLFAGTPPYVWLSNLYTNNGKSGVSQFTCDGQSGRPKAPVFNIDNAVTPPVLCNGVGPTTGTNIGNVNTVDPNYKQTQLLRATFGIDRKLPWGMTGTIDALYSKSFNSPYMVNLELPDPIGTDFGGRVMYGTLATNGRATTNFKNGAKYSGGAYDLRNASTDYAYSVSAGVTKRFNGSIEGSAFYTYGRSYSAQDFTSSTARSNFINGRVTALNQFDDQAGVSAFDRPHRVNAAITYTAPWKSYPTDISLLYSGQSGTNFTYVYQTGVTSSGDLNGDGVAGNDPVYIPVNTSEITFEAYSGSVSGAAARNIPASEQAEALDKFLKSMPCMQAQRGHIMERNSCKNPWFNGLDLSVRQSLPKVGGHGLTMVVDIFNFLNFMNSDWGQYRQNTSFSQANLFQHRGQTADGKPIVRFDPSLNDLNFKFVKSLSARNYWQAQVTMRYAY